MTKNKEKEDKLTDKSALELKAENIADAKFIQFIEKSADHTEKRMERHAGPFMASAIMGLCFWYTGLKGYFGYYPNGMSSAVFTSVLIGGLCAGVCLQGIPSLIEESKEVSKYVRLPEERDLIEMKLKEIKETSKSGFLIGNLFVSAVLTNIYGLAVSGFCMMAQHGGHALSAMASLSLIGGYYGLQNSFRAFEMKNSYDKMYDKTLADLTKEAEERKMLPPKASSVRALPPPTRDSGRFAGR